MKARIRLSICIGPAVSCPANDAREHIRGNIAMLTRTAFLFIKIGVQMIQARFARAGCLQWVKVTRNLQDESNYGG